MEHSYGRKITHVILLSKTEDETVMNKFKIEIILKDIPHSLKVTGNRLCVRSIIRK